MGTVSGSEGGLLERSLAQAQALSCGPLLAYTASVHNGRTVISDRPSLSKSVNESRSRATPVFNFCDAFEALTEHRPFPWQRRLFEGHFSCGMLPSAVDIPTGLGKTAVMAVWLLARAAGAPLPRRLVYVVDRRAVVDQATAFAEELCDRLREDERLEAVRHGLELGDRPLPISTLRGRYADNREWMADPAAPAIVVGTVDMVGSRLLFEGYGLSRRMRPFAAGLLGCDTLVMLDEAHLARPFERLLKAIEAGQRLPLAGETDPGAGAFAGPAADNRFPPPFRVLPLSATLGHDADSELFDLKGDDKENRTVRTRLEARKSLRVQDLPSGTKLEQALADEAWAQLQAVSAAAETPPAIAVYCHRREHAEKVADTLRKQAGKEEPPPVVILLVGSRRVRERQEAAEELQERGLMGDAEATRSEPVFLVATSAGEVGVDLDADHMVCDLVAWERMVQRLGRVNRRGTGSARVLVIDQGAPDAKRKDEDAVARHEAVCRLLDALQQDETGGRQAGPAALGKLAEDPAQRAQINKATTPMPLYPALTRPLVDAWAMTSLEDHAGRPEVGPWLRGWGENDEPQSAVVWRQHLPLHFPAHGGTAKAQAARDIRAFFAAAPPQTTELLETETSQVAAWLKRRADRRLKQMNEAPVPAPASDDGTHDGEQAVATTGPRAPLTRGGPVAFLLDGANRPLETLSLATIGERPTNALRASLAGKRLVLDARFGGIVEGLLTVGAEGDGCAATVENNWGDPDHDGEESAWTLKVETLSDDERARRLGERAASEGAAGTADSWQDELHAPFSVSAEGGAESWLVVSRRRGTGESEDAKAVARRAQRLDEHQKWAGEKAADIADRLRLDPEDKAMLMAAARHHDDGKATPRWQRAFNAVPEGGPYAKTTGSPNQHLLNGFRHELKSALDAERNGLDGLDRASPRFELALHLIAAHHGFARPAIRVRGYDDLPPSEAEASAHMIAVRFARLQRQWGPWGLAWWEALLRAADQAASRRLGEEKD